MYSHSSVAIYRWNYRNKLVFGESKAPLKAKDGSIRLRCIVDRTSVEIFANGGRIYMPCRLRADDDNKSLKVFSKGGSAHIEEMTVYEIESIWH